MTSSRTVAVTGAEGFIGSHLVEALVASGHRVRAMAQYNSFSSFGWLETLPEEVTERVDVVLGDVRDAGSVRSLLDGTEAVYHLAALIAIPYSYRAPHSYVRVGWSSAHKGTRRTTPPFVARASQRDPSWIGASSASRPPTPRFTSSSSGCSSPRAWAR